MFRISEKNLSREELKALNNLVKIKDLVIQKADKDNHAVILNRRDYKGYLYRETLRGETNRRDWLTGEALRGYI